jgi:hypothetical protein
MKWRRLIRSPRQSLQRQSIRKLLPSCQFCEPSPSIVTIDSKGRAIPKLYSKLQASKELRAMLNLGARSEAADVTKLSDAELLAQLAQQAKELGIEIDLNDSFAQPKKTDE